MRRRLRRQARREVDSAYWQYRQHYQLPRNGGSDVCDLELLLEIEAIRVWSYVRAGKNPDAVITESDPEVEDAMTAIIAGDSEEAWEAFFPFDTPQGPPVDPALLAQYRRPQEG